MIKRESEKETEEDLKQAFRVFDKVVTMSLPNISLKLLCRVCACHLFGCLLGPIRIAPFVHLLQKNKQDQHQQHNQNDLIFELLFCFPAP